MLAEQIPQFSVGADLWAAIATVAERDSGFRGNLEIERCLSERCSGKRPLLHVALVVRHASGAEALACFTGQTFGLAPLSPLRRGTWKLDVLSPLLG